MIPLSVIIPTLNEERYLPQVVQSLFDAAYAPLEIIVVDGQSTDNTVQAVQQMQAVTPPGVALRVMISEAQNVSAHRNLGARHASHELILFLDADTLVPTPAHLSELAHCF